MSIQNTNIRSVRNVLRYTIGTGGINELPEILEKRRKPADGAVIFLVDNFFSDKPHLLEKLNVYKSNELIFIPTENEPTTDYVDQLVLRLIENGHSYPASIVGMGGGTTMDIAKAVSNLITNGGKAKDYQGWDLVKLPGIHKIAIPTISGTGSEATRTCVMTNKANKLKLGMNSDFTVFDQIIMDPDLTSTVPNNQYFFTGMDAFIHCIEALAGNYRNAIGDAYSRETINLCRQVFLGDNMKSPENRERLMVASYLGGCAIATSYVGLIHPFSAGLSVVLGIHHCEANCIVMRAMQPYYSREYKEFWDMANKQQIEIPKGVCSDLSVEQYEQLFAATIIHEKPLTNALGDNYKKILTKEKVKRIFSQM